MIEQKGEKNNELKQLNRYSFFNNASTAYL
jgi:L-fucose mutarotase/ribose pyranase (RbsD/FucU family)